LAVARLSTKKVDQDVVGGNRKKERFSFAYGLVATQITKTRVLFKEVIYYLIMCTTGELGLHRHGNTFP